MIEPKYTLNNKILMNLSTIERIYGQLESKTIPQELFLNLERNNLFKSSYSSNSIEGNPLSEQEVTNLLLGDRIPVNRDEKEVHNYFNILKSFDDKYKNLDLDTVLSMHKELLTGVNNDIAGKIRESKVVVGNPTETGEIIIKHDPPAHTRTEIEMLLNELFDWVGGSTEVPILKAGIYHHQFVYVHPFVDGNGRTARLSTALLLHQYNYKINKYFIIDDYYDIDRIQYSDALHSADGGDKTEWLEYFTDGVKYSLQSALAKVENGLQSLSFDLRPTKREMDVLDILKKYKELTSAQVAIDLNISRQQAFNLLNGLIEKGLLIKEGETKNSYYHLK